jgi:hypothetical protein
MKRVTLETLESYIVAGMSHRFWYEQSNAAAGAWCQDNNQDLTTFLTVTAILSPRVQVIRNIRLAKQWALSRSADGIMKQRVNALNVYHATGKVSGTKINAFLDSLLLKPGAVCIDIHMSRIFGFAKGELMQNTKHWSAMRAKAQRIVARLAARFDMETYQAQAALWCGYLKLTQGYSADRFGAMAF